MTRFASKCETCDRFHERGDCVTAVIASLLELPLHEVPFFVDSGPGWGSWLDEWLDKRGLVIEPVTRADLPPGPVWASGASPRGFSHAVVWAGGPGGGIVHDPHPSRAGIVEPFDFRVIRPATRLCGPCGRGAV